MPADREVAERPVQGAPLTSVLPPRTAGGTRELRDDIHPAAVGEPQALRNVAAPVVVAADDRVRSPPPRALRPSWAPGALAVEMIGRDVEQDADCGLQRRVSSIWNRDISTTWHRSGPAAAAPGWRCRGCRHLPPAATPGCGANAWSICLVPGRPRTAAGGSWPDPSQTAMSPMISTPAALALPPPVRLDASPEARAKYQRRKRLSRQWRDLQPKPRRREPAGPPRCRPPHHVGAAGDQREAARKASMTSPNTATVARRGGHWGMQL